MVDILVGLFGLFRDEKLKFEIVVKELERDGIDGLLSNSDVYFK